MTVRELQYATQDLIDCGASKDTDELFVKVDSDNVRIYVRTQGDAELLAILPAE